MPMSSAMIEDAVAQAFRSLGHEGALLTVGNETKFNTMTIGWGALGFIWGRNTVTVLVRPTRYTHEFIEKFPSFTVSFYRSEHHKALSILGSRSGRDTDKVALAGLTPAFIDSVVTFREAYLTVVAKKLCRMQLQPGDFIDPTIDGGFYPKKDYHTIYQAEVMKIIAQV
jgi:flavin reductase (DIM6/NTAB) family NADH-FMN oxidoreductase RutF